MAESRPLPPEAMNRTTGPLPSGLVSITPELTGIASIANILKGMFAHPMVECPREQVLQRAALAVVLHRRDRTSQATHKILGVHMTKKRGVDFTTHGFIP